MVKFGLYLLANLNPEWSNQYVEYNPLKREIRTLAQQPQQQQQQIQENGSGDDSPNRFVDLLTANIQRAEDFFKLKQRQLAGQFELLVEKAATTSSLHSIETKEQKNDIIKLYVELQQLREFGTLNYTAVAKILKKHDKNLPLHPLKAWFMKTHVDDLSVFGTQETLVTLVSKVRNHYAAAFEEGDRHKADEVLVEAVKSAARRRERQGAESIPTKKCFILDMDGVVYHGDRLLPGVVEFVKWMDASNKKYLFLTNGSTRTPLEIQAKLKRLGLEVGPDVFHTSAISTAMFLQSQTPNGRAFVIGDNGLRSALLDVGYSITDDNPDYVVVGETRSFSFDLIEKAVNLVYKGAKLIGTNCDAVDNATFGFTPACGALCAPIERATGKAAYYCGKPNALMFRTAVEKLGADAHECLMIGDRMDTDIQGALESGLGAILVLSGISKVEDLDKFAFRPTHVLKDLSQMVQLVSSVGDD